MDLKLKNKVVVITGGATGIGRAAAEEFLHEGAKVAVFARRKEVLQAFHDDMVNEGYDLYFESVDVTDTEGVKAFAQRVYEKFGAIDVWVNNAGTGKDRYFMDYTDADWERMNNINLKAVFECIQIAASYMMKQNSGVILNASSAAARIPFANGVIYAATKAAVSSMTRSAAAALAPYGIRVVGYVPGMIVTPLVEHLVAANPQKYTRNIAMGRVGCPADLAQPIVFLASNAAHYITGIDLEISGGKLAVQDCEWAWKDKAENNR